uniref:Immunoglobulin V-set domain-containing protein n=1 Tax=Neogobius melanostomus TaxID=47308 RepID=A0A8C6SIF8_9GOBI
MLCLIQFTPVMSLKLSSLSLVAAEVSCAVGTDCLLPCRFLFASSVSIHWRKIPGEIQVHSYYDDGDQLRRQDPDYTDRTDLPGVIRRGEASLRIKKVKVQDEGRYIWGSDPGRKMAERYGLPGVDDDGQHLPPEPGPGGGITGPDARRCDGQSPGGGGLVCHSEGVYPEPAVTWIAGLSVNQGRTTVHQREDQLYDIHSSVTLQSAFTVFSLQRLALVLHSFAWPARHSSFLFKRRTVWAAARSQSFHDLTHIGPITQQDAEAVTCHHHALFQNIKDGGQYTVFFGSFVCFKSFGKYEIPKTGARNSVRSVPRKKGRFWKGFLPLVTATYLALL